MPSNTMNDMILEMNNITKNFPGVLALDDVSINLKKGEILGLLGENGAGKSTLIKILSGVYRLEEGEIIVDGESLVFFSPKDSLDKGIRVIYQEIPSFEPLTVVENIFAGELEFKRFGIVDWGKMVKKAQKILSDFCLDINPMELMSNISVAEKQIIEIAKAVHAKAKIIVMDEPTSSLSREDTEILYSIIRKLKEEGVAIIYITHRLEEIFEVTDRITVLRDGKKIDDLITKETNTQECVNLIVGKSFSELYPKQDIEKGEVILEVKDLSYLNKLKNISFHVRAGEILAFYGLVGSGIHMLLNVLFGDLPKTSGAIFVNGKKVEINHPYFAQKHFIGFVPADRREEGIAQNMDVKLNIVSANIDQIGNGSIFNKKLQNNRAKYWVDKLNIKTPGLNNLIRYLSGGNQQKVVVSKWLESKSKILFMAEPSRGIDVGSKAEIYNITEELCKEGTGVVMVSTELPEIMAIADRVIVMKKGEIVKEVSTKDTTQEELISTVCS